MINIKVFDNSWVTSETAKKSLENGDFSDKRDIISNELDEGLSGLSIDSAKLVLKSIGKRKIKEGAHLMEKMKSGDSVIVISAIQVLTNSKIPDGQRKLKVDGMFGFNTLSAVKKYLYTDLDVKGSPLDVFVSDSFLSNVFKISMIDIGMSGNADVNKVGGGESDKVVNNGEKEVNISGEKQIDITKVTYKNGVPVSIGGVSVVNVKEYKSFKGFWFVRLQGKSGYLKIKKDNSMINYGKEDVGDNNDIASKSYYATAIFRLGNVYNDIEWGDSETFFEKHGRIYAEEKGYGLSDYIIFKKSELDSLGVNASSFAKYLNKNKKTVKSRALLSNTNHIKNIKTYLNRNGIKTNKKGKYRMKNGSIVYETYVYEYDGKSDVDTSVVISKSNLKSTGFNYHLLLNVLNGYV